MPHSIRVKVLGVGGVLGVVAATLTLAAGPAAAAPPRPPHCGAPSGQSCVKIVNKTTQVNSLRESKTNRCLLNIPPNQTRYYTDVFISLADNVNLKGYTGSRCEGDTEFTPFYGTWDGPDQDNYIFTEITNIVTEIRNT
jgi:hypothetical protein